MDEDKIVKLVYWGLGILVAGVIVLCAVLIGQAGEKANLCNELGGVSYRSVCFDRDAIIEVEQ